MNKLYIIGNGFDLHHGLKTKYIDFYNYLKENHGDFLERFGNIYDISEKSQLWSDFEGALQYINPRYLYSRWEQPAYGSDDFSCSEYHEFANFCKDEMVEIYINLRSLFREWINSIDVAKDASRDDLYSAIDKKAIFLNFNYTLTLEKIYEVPEINVLHIHGKQNDSNDLVFGHSCDYGIINQLLSQESEEPDDIEPTFQFGVDEITLAMSNLQKRSNSIIESNNEFWTGISDVDKVYIYGHSLSAVDSLYIKKVADSIRDSATWSIRDINAISAIRKKHILMNTLKISAGRIFYTDDEAEERWLQQQKELEGY